MTGYAIVLTTDELEKVTATSIIASVAAASDIPVDVFVTMNGLLAFERDAVEAGDFNAGPVGQAMLEGDAGEVPLYTDQLSDAKELGPLSIYACTMAMDVMGHELDDYVDVFDGELGVAGFLGKAEDKQVIFA